MAVPNLTERVTRMSALVLAVAPTATTDEITDRLQQLTGTAAWLTAGSRAVPADPYQVRAVQAARVLAADDRSKSRAVVDFLAADYALPEIDRMVPPTPEPHTGTQLALIA